MGGWGRQRLWSVEKELQREQTLLTSNTLCLGTCESRAMLTSIPDLYPMVPMASSLPRFGVSDLTSEVQVSAPIPKVIWKTWPWFYMLGPVVVTMQHLQRRVSLNLESGLRHLGPSQTSEHEAGLSIRASLYSSTQLHDKTGLRVSLHSWIPLWE